MKSGKRNKKNEMPKSTMATEYQDEDREQDRIG